MFDSLQNENVLVTGGSMGIGYGVCKKLAEYGMNVFLIYNSTEVDVKELNCQIKGKNGSVAKYHINVNDEEEIRHTIDEIEAKYGVIPYLVNCAGITKDNYMLMMQKGEWQSVMNTNLTGTFNVIQAMLTGMILNQKGSIVNISSIAGIKGVAGQANYCASKAGIIGLTKALAKEVAPKNIRVNVVAPGYIETRMIEKVKKNKELVSTIPMNRFGSVEDIANTVLFLLSDGAKYITGSTIVVDGGITA